MRFVLITEETTHLEHQRIDMADLSESIRLRSYKANRSNSDPVILVAGEQLQVVSEIRYLWVLIDSNFPFTS